MALYTASHSIPKRSKKCVVCQTVFRTDDELVSCLSGKTRRDYCLRCWGKSKEEGTSVWRVKVFETKSKRRFVDLFDRSLELLRSYLEAEDSKAYTLALYLQRQGALYRLRSIRSHKGTALFEVAETQETLVVPVANPAPRGSLEQDLMQALTGDA